jgi:chloramphenicol O-acetyltransferase type A
MDQPTEPLRSTVDLEPWERRVVFQFFKDFEEPYHGVCVRIDCTATFDYAKQHGLSVFLSLMHRSLVAARQVEQLRTRIEGETVWLYDHLNGGSAVGRPNGTIGFGYYQFQESLQEFVAEASLELQRVRGRVDLERRPTNSLIRYSVLPWFDFTSISHARQFKHSDSAPRITFGKITDLAGRRSMPVSIHVHHGLADGLHVADYLGRFQQCLDAPG